MNEVGLEDQSKEPLVNGGHANGGRGRSRGRGRSAEENDIEHHLGPLVRVCVCVCVDVPLCCALCRVVSMLVRTRQQDVANQAPNTTVT